MRLLRGAEPKHQHQRMYWRCLEAIVKIELLGLIVQGMYQQSTYTNILRDSLCSKDSILKQSSAELHALSAPVNREAAKNQHRNRIRHIAANRAGSIMVRNSTSSQRVVTEHVALRIDHHKHAACAGQVIGQRAALEPVVKRRFAAFKGTELVGSLQGLRRGKLQRH